MPPKLLPYLVETMIRARTAEAERRGEEVGRAQISAATTVSPSTITEFETQPSWRLKTDAIVAGYAAVSNRPVADLWREAIDRMETDLKGQGRDVDAPRAPRFVKPKSPSAQRSG